MRAFFLAALIWLAAIVPAYDATIDRLVTTGTKTGGITCSLCGGRIWVVQKADNHAASPLTSQATTLGVAPTQNNMLVAFIEYGASNACTAASPATGWTVLPQPTCSTYMWAAAWHLVGASESATQSPLSSPTCECNVTIYELGGVATNFTSSEENLSSASTTTSSLSLTYTTLNGNDLSLFFGGGETTGLASSGSNCGSSAIVSPWGGGSARGFAYASVGPGILSGNALSCTVTNTFNQYPMGGFLLTLHP